MRRLIIAGLSGDSGKTVISLSLLAALRRKGLTLSVFKKGPDYIDTAWLGRVAHTDCRNLDTYLVDPHKVYRSFVTHAAGSDVAIIEGNRGLYDGKDVAGTHSTSELAKLLQTPVTLVVNATKVTRTIAALVNGCIAFDPEVKIVGVILNKVAGSRHARIITESIEKYCNLPVLGVVPKLDDDSVLIPGRHLGLVPPAEFAEDVQLEQRLAAIAEEHLNVDALIEVVSQAPPLEATTAEPSVTSTPKVKIGYFNDSAFSFYYPENLEALRAEGAEIIPLHSLKEKALPEIDALFIGGGFPETHAEHLAANRSLLESVKRQAEKGMPIYAECGGLIFLARSLCINDSVYPMAGVLPIDVRLHQKPVGHGYTLNQVDRKNPFFEISTVIKGHEFHYSDITSDAEPITTCMDMKSGVGIGEKRDGIVYKNVMASYTHIHSAGVPSWAPAVVRQARVYRSRQAGWIARPPEAGERTDKSHPENRNKRVELCQR